MLLLLLKKIYAFTLLCAIFELMAQLLLIAHPDNATIEELKQVSPVGFNETATRCSAIQMLLPGPIHGR